MVPPRFRILSFLKKCRLGRRKRGGKIWMLDAIESSSLACLNNGEEEMQRGACVRSPNKFVNIIKKMKNEKEKKKRRRRRQRPPPPHFYISHIDR